MVKSAQIALCLFLTVHYCYHLFVAGGTLSPTVPLLTIPLSLAALLLHIRGVLFVAFCILSTLAYVGFVDYVNPGFYVSQVSYPCLFSADINVVSCRPFAVWGCCFFNVAATVAMVLMFRRSHEKYSQKLDRELAKSKTEQDALLKFLSFICHEVQNPLHAIRVVVSKLHHSDSDSDSNSNQSDQGQGHKGKGLVPQQRSRQSRNMTNNDIDVLDLCSTQVGSREEGGGSRDLAGIASWYRRRVSTAPSR